jgi:signal transduction histidine kinase
MHGWQPSGLKLPMAHHGTGENDGGPVRQVHRSHAELDYFVRALSHDMSANFMLLEDSFSRLKRSIDNPAQPDRQELTAHVDACLRESKRFLNDLVDLARTGHVAMEPSGVDPGAVLDEVLFEQRDLLQGRGVRVNVRRPLPPVWCNPHRLKQILANLVRNAVLHGCDPQEPAVTISAEQTLGPGPSRLVAVRVHDNGRGVEPRFREEIFLPGRRLSDAASQGSGMGLAIVKKIVAYYGGRVYLDPRCQNGTAIVFCLPPMAEQESGMRPARGERMASERADRNLEPDDPHEQGVLHAHQPLKQPVPPIPNR